MIRILADTSSRPVAWTRRVCRASPSLLFPASLKIRHRHHTHLAFPFLLFSLILAGCGKIGEPLPPLIRIPQPVGDLAAQQQGRQVTLSWTLPKLNTDGSSATTMALVEVFRVIHQPGVSPVLKEYDPWRLLQTGSFPAQGRRVLIDSLEGLDNSEMFGGEFSYAVRVFNLEKQTAGFSNVVTLRLLPVPHPPRELVLKPNEAFVEVSWVPSSTNIDDSPAVPEMVFNVYRSLRPGDPVEAPLNPSPVAKTSFRDESARLGAQYFYKVRAVVETARGQVESWDSDPVFLVHRDVYPPAPPLQFTIVRDRGFLSLVWFPNSEADLAGYHVYRSQGKEGYERLTSEVIERTSYLDQDLQKGQHYSYRITAVDQLGNESGYSNVVSDALE